MASFFALYRVVYVSSSCVPPGLLCAGYDAEQFELLAVNGYGLYVAECQSRKNLPGRIVSPEHKQVGRPAVAEHMVDGFGIAHQIRIRGVFGGNVSHGAFRGNRRRERDVVQHVFNLNIPLLTNSRLAAAFIQAFCTIKPEDLAIKSWEEYK